MAAYADWEFYTEVFLGSAIEQGAFPRLALRASAELDMLTFGRIDAAAAETDPVKMACCAMCDVLHANTDAQTGVENQVVAQERLDDYSISYAATAQSTRSLKSKLLDAARVYLWRTGLLGAAVPYREV